MSEIIYPDESYKIMGACFEVYNHKGFGFTEPIYQECLEYEFGLRNIPFVAQPEISMTYKDLQMAQTFRPDFICFDKIIVEIKSVKSLADAHRAQLINYLHATQLDLGLLINFGQYPKLISERFAMNDRHAAATNVYQIMASRTDG